MREERKAEASVVSGTEVGQTRASEYNQGGLLLAGSGRPLVNYLLKCCRQLRSLAAGSDDLYISWLKEQYGEPPGSLSSNSCRFFSFQCLC